MPTYEYVCEECGKTFDYFQSMSAPRLERCIFEGCGGKVRRKLGTGAGIIFKGSGFYETDYRSEAYKSAAKKEAEGGKAKGKDDGGAKKEKAAGDKGGSTGGTKKKEAKGVSAAGGSSGGGSS